MKACLGDSGQCQPTTRRRNFTVASGQRVSDLIVYKVPLWIAGFKGEAHSAEMPGGNNTPLMLFSSAWQAFGAAADLTRSVLLCSQLADAAAPLPMRRWLVGWLAGYLADWQTGCFT